MHSQLTREQRCQMEALVSSDSTQKEIAGILKIHPSTVCRELRRNGRARGRGYCASEAQNKAEGRRRKPPPRIPARVRREVERLMRERGWTPQAISERLKRERGVLVSHEWIYRMIEKDRDAGGDLHTLLPCSKKRRKRRGVPETRGRIPDRTPIHERPAEADDRSETGHWEGDTVIGARHKGVFVTVAERRTRFFEASVAGRKTKTRVNDAMMRCMRKHKSRCESITFDNGREFSGHVEVGRKLDAGTFFADPYSSWQRGTNEWLNRRLRCHFPKGTSLADVTEAKLKKALHKINRFPMKVLDWMTPYEAYYGVVQTLTRNCV